MDKQTNTPQRQGASVIVWRVVSVALLLAAIAYVVWTGDFDDKGIVGRADDFLVFMAAFTFAHGSFQRPERRYIRRQLYMIALLFAILALCWIAMLMCMG